MKKALLLLLGMLVTLAQMTLLSAHAQAPGFPLEEQDKTAAALCCAAAMAQEYANVEGQEVSATEILQTAEAFYCEGTCEKHDEELVKATQQHLTDDRWKDKSCDPDTCRSQF